MCGSFNGRVIQPNTRCPDALHDTLVTPDDNPDDEDAKGFSPYMAHGIRCGTPAIGGKFEKELCLFQCGATVVSLFAVSAVKDYSPFANDQD